jgi:hypothetical protein
MKIFTDSKNPYSNPAVAVNLVSRVDSTVQQIQLALKMKDKKPCFTTKHKQHNIKSTGMCFKPAVCLFSVYTVYVCVGTLMESLE